MAGFVPHCGAPPVPGALRWKLDQFLIGSLLFLAGAGLAYARLRAVVARDFCEPFRMALAFISPLCHLSVALFSARVAQHMAITLRRSAADRARVPSRRQAHAMARGSWGQCFRLGQHARLRCNLLALARSPLLRRDPAEQSRLLASQPDDGSKDVFHITPLSAAV